MRISRHQMFMDMAEVAAKRSTCFRGNTGAIIVDSAHNIISMGYNGPPSGEDHCHGNECQLRTDGGCLRSIHAEENAIRRAQDRLSTKFLGGLHLYTLYSPCFHCATEIHKSGIEEVYYRYPYRDQDALKVLESRKVFKVLPAGFLIEQWTGKILASA